MFIFELKQCSGVFLSNTKKIGDFFERKQATRAELQMQFEKCQEDAP